MYGSLSLYIYIYIYTHILYSCPGPGRPGPGREPGGPKLRALGSLEGGGQTIKQ